MTRKPLKNQYVFHSISELIDALDNSELQKDDYGDYRETASSEPRDSGWSDTTSYEQARERMLNGYTYEDIEMDIKDYRSKGTGKKNRSYQSVAGHQVIVPLYLQGIPNSMINKKPVINNKIVTIVYDCSTPHYVNSDDIMKTTKELIKNIVSLEEQGYRCNVWIIESNNNKGGKWGFALKLKTDREVLNIKKMMFPLVSSSFLRRIGFKIKENLFKDWIGNGYGSATYDKDIIDKFIRQNLGISKYELWRWDGKKF